MKVNATAYLEVSVNPIYIVEEIHIISRGNWIVEKKGKYIEMTEESVGQHSFDRKVGEVSQEVYELYKAKRITFRLSKKEK